MTMTQKEILNKIIKYVYTYILSYEEYHSFGTPERFHKYVKEHFLPIPKSELELNKEYNGICKNGYKVIWATWNGEKFVYTQSKFSETINHYEDDNDGDVFIPIKEI